MCVITKEPIIEVCHIFPFANKRYPKHAKEILLQGWFFVDESRRQKVVEILYDDNKIDQPDNMITLSLNAHKLWSQSVIAFEPYARSKDHVVLKVRWLKKRDSDSPKYSPWAPMDLETNPNAVLCDHPENIKLFDNVSCRPILDGHEVVIKSTDQAKCPNWDLLQLQWDMCRMASLCGAAEALEEKVGGDDDDDDAIEALVGTLRGTELGEGSRGRISQPRGSRARRPSRMSSTSRASLGERSPLTEHFPHDQRAPPATSPQRPRQATVSRQGSVSPLKTDTDSSAQTSPQRQQRVGGGSNQENEGF